MRIVFAGTPEYAVPSLQALAVYGAGHQVVGVVTQPDRARGRSKQLQPPPVKVAARALGLGDDAIFQPQSINERAALDALRALAPDLLCVVAYGGLLKDEALSLAKLYPINAHGSLLPRHRGAAPIAAAIAAGDDQTGVCIMKMERGLDSGPVMVQRELGIQPDDTAGTLHDKLAALSATCFRDALRLIDEGHAHFAAQDESQATYAPKLSKDSGRIDWTKPAAALERHVRAMTPWPGAWTTVAAPDGSAAKRLRVHAAALPKQQPPQRPAPGKAEPFETKDPQGRETTALCAGCGDGGTLLLLAVQAEGAKPMSVREFLNGAGRPYAGGCRLGA